ncbi:MULTISPECIES: phospholipase D-like domain-containing protein [Pontibacillus]|uniref:phospholipase D n=1 Tax=Pontibacillus chungwhensis TaxID=265426 RepID=A0ABY8UZF1_9BACI|nr:MULTISPECIES: phospholipase D-like domain-containing protein [Pontibacillus]MCD5324644.1 phospholipase D-like domain-containing protein [Pontibacillus sp. HN14]WIF99062.1 phospholipase D-like domain-containing protein [Pontibacillus chungwhensis]
MKKSGIIRIVMICSLVLTFVPVKQVDAVTEKDVVISEIAWMGTTSSYNDEWIELSNNTSANVSLEGWTLEARDGSPSISLSGTISGDGSFILERTDDTTVTEVAADMIYAGSLSNSGEVLELRNSSGVLIDSVDKWYAGDNSSKSTMERAKLQGNGTDQASWADATDTYSGGYGTPSVQGEELLCDSKEHINQVSNEVGAINVYFNKCAYGKYATSQNTANYNVNLEDRLIQRIEGATESIDMATYEINLPGVIDALVRKAAQGVNVRVIADAKDGSDPHYTERYQTMRLYLEQLVRGEDGIVGTNDDVEVFSDSIMLAVEDPVLREEFGLTSTPVGMKDVTVEVGSGTLSGYNLAGGEEKAPGSFYSPGNQMHNKFAVIDGEWVFTGSWNFTVTGLYGTEDNRKNGVLGGNTQHVVELHSSELAAIYKTEFDEMWGASGMVPDPANSNYHGRKTDNTPHTVTVGGREVEVYFSAGDDAVGHMADVVKNEADYGAYFTIFAWSDQTLVNELKNKWEGSYNDLEGSLTGFDVKGVYDEGFWNQWWSASIEMTGRTASQTSTNNPNVRWNHAAPVYEDNEDRKLHSKTMLIDPTHSESDPTAIIGSTNWSTNGNDINDENMLFIHDAQITNQFLQEFYARYDAAGGILPVQ